MNKPGNGMSRRRFLQSSALALGAVNLAPSGVLAVGGSPGANGRFVVGHIGVGGMGMTHVFNMLRFQQEGKVRVAAVCDADDNRLEAAVNNAGAGVIPYRDYRYLLERKDIDAVLIATPDHWHAVQTVHACQSGKHVYVEKPASVTVREGQAMVAAARANKRGTRCRSRGPQIKCGRSAQVSRPSPRLAASTCCSASALLWA